MAWWNRSRRTVDIDDLAPDDRVWLEQEADRIAVDPVTFVRMLIRRTRTESATRIRVEYGRSPGFAADLPSTSELAAATREWEEKARQDTSADIDVEALLAAELANAEQIGAPPAASNGAVQVVGGRPPAPFHIPRGMG